MQNQALYEASLILCEGTEDKPWKVQQILEDAESPITRKTTETLYKSITDRNHVDFGDIPKSKGDIRQYSGYQTMVDTLEAINALSSQISDYKELSKYSKIISEAIGNIEKYADMYKSAYNKKNDAIMLEYNAFVFTCVEAITSLLYQFTTFMRTPSSHELKVVFENTKYRADLFYIDQLIAYNKVCASGNYKKYLSQVITSGTENLTGAFIVGSVAIVSTVALSIVPVTRRIIYTVQNLRGRLSEALALQAYFLELNAEYIKADKSRDKKETEKILAKQEAIRMKFIRLAEKLRVKSVAAEQLAQRSLNDDNRTISIDSMRDKASDDNSDISIF